MRIRIKRDYKTYKAGEIVKVGKKKAEFLIKNGYAIQSRDMTPNDYKEK